MSFLSRAFRRPANISTPTSSFQPATIQVNYPGGDPGGKDQEYKINALLTYPPALKSFATHMLNEWTPNEIVFYFAVDSFRKYPTEAKAILLIQYFIVKNSPHELNIADSMRTTISNAATRPNTPRQRVINHQSISRTIFDNVQALAKAAMVEPMSRWIPRDEGNAHFFEEKHLAPNSAAQEFRSILRTLGLQGFHFPSALTSI